MTRILFLLTCIFCAAISRADGADNNLAQGKKYTLSPAPNYKLCTDAEDKTQLTDGKVTASYFWTQTGTVGWVHTKFPTITIDLEKIEPIGRVEFTTAAGKAGVTPPLAVFVQVSDDGKEYREVCDIMAEDATLNGLFPETYVIRCLQTKSLNVRGRYVRFVCVPGTFCFCDEIRIFRGDESCLDRTPSGEIVVSPEATVNRFRVGLLMGKRIRTDISMITEVAENAQIDAETKNALKERLAELGKSPIPEIDQKTFTTVFPMSDVHREIYRTQAALWRALECEKVTVKPATLWDPVDRFAIPKMVPDGELNVHVMQNETRAVAFNVYNASPISDETVFIKLPDFRGLAEVEAYYAPWTDSSNAWSSASALVPLEVKNGVVSVPAQSGLVTQVWFRVKACKNKENNAKNSVKTVTEKILWCASDEKGAIPLTVNIYPIQFPEKTTLLLGGWDYLDGNGAYNVNPENRASFLKYVTSRHVNAPWGRAGVLESCKVNADLSVTLDTARFDKWVAMYPDAKEYFVFLGKGGWSSQTAPKFLGYELNSPEGRTVVKNFFSAWKEHWAKIGFDSKKLSILIHDEPNEGTQMEQFTLWNDIFHEACPEIQIWSDPCYRDLMKVPVEYTQGIDTLCPNRTQWLEQPAAFEKFYIPLRQEGKTLHLYSCTGPARELDPYSYYLLQAWHATRIGAKASFFWALGDGGGTNSWAEYFLGRNAYCPLFIDPKSSEVTPAKQMEAMSESAQDYEYIVMLRKKCPERATELDKLLDGVLQASDADKIYWKEPKDRSLTEKARLQILAWLMEAEK